MLISRVSKIKKKCQVISSFLFSLSPSKKETQKNMSSSRNTSDSWVKKATGGLSPGSMAPLSSAVNMAASAYGVGFGSLSFSFFGSLLCF